MASALQRALKLLSAIQNNICNSFSFLFPQENLTLVTLNWSERRNSQLNQLSLEELLNESVLWAVPKKRKTVEKRLNKKFGWPQYVYKPLRPLTNILTCIKCGSHHRAGELCPTCYVRVMEETKAMQEAIQKELGISPVENEVVVLYEDDKKDIKFFEGKRIVEMKKKRPKLFSDNLLQKSMQGASDTTEVMENSIVK